MTEHWAVIYANQKEINYISPSNIRASVETRLSKLHNYFTPILSPFHPWHFMRPDLPPELCEVLQYTYF